MDSGHFPDAGHTGQSAGNGHEDQGGLQKIDACISAGIRIFSHHPGFISEPGPVNQKRQHNGTDQGQY